MPGWMAVWAWAGAATKNRRGREAVQQWRLPELPPQIAAFHDTLAPRWQIRDRREGVTCLMSTLPLRETARPLEGRKILVVEDEAPIALSLASGVSQAGGTVIGPVATVAGAFAAMADHTLDGALLDIRLRNETSFALADVLAVLGIPFIFVSGLSSA
jgi:hypothetical protein